MREIQPDFPTRGRRHARSRSPHRRPRRLSAAAAEAWRWPDRAGPVLISRPPSHPVATQPSAELPAGFRSVKRALCARSPTVTKVPGFRYPAPHETATPRQNRPDRVRNLPGNDDVRQQGGRSDEPAHPGQVVRGGRRLSRRRRDLSGAAGRDGRAAARRSSANGSTTSRATRSDRRHQGGGPGRRLVRDRRCAPGSTALDRHHIERAVEGSLKRLGTDYIDLYQTHWPDPELPIEVDARRRCRASSRPARSATSAAATRPRTG